MAIVKIRCFRVPAVQPEDTISRDNICSRDEFDLELNLAAMLRQNALAVPYRGPLLMKLVNREMALVVSMFGRTPPGTRLIRHEAFESSSSHIRRFTTEVFALGGLTACVERVDKPIPEPPPSGPLAVAHFDTLPEALKAAYPSRGVRPDLRFARGDYIIAGEARGRNKPVPRNKLITREEIDRLNQLLTWSRQPGCDPVCMAWSWMQQSSTVIDFFRFEPNLLNEPMKRTSVRELESALLDLDRATQLGNEVTDMPVDSTKFPYVGDEYPRRDRDAGWFRYRELSAKRELIRSTIEDREMQLIESVPDVPAIELDRPWYGEWHPASLLDDQRNCNVLLAAS